MMTHRDMAAFCAKHGLEMARGDMSPAAFYGWMVQVAMVAAEQADRAEAALAALAKASAK